MNPVMQDLLERVADGLVWVNADGVVTFSNQHAQTFAGLKEGDTLPDCPLARAVAVIASGKLDRRLQLEFEPQTGTRQLLLAQVGPGMAAGEAWVYFKPPPAYGEALALQNLMTVIRTDLAQPLTSFASAMKSAMAGDNPDGFKRALENVALVSDTVNRLVDLASIWESEDLLAHDRLEIWPLLNECWLRQEAHALSKKLTVRLINRVEGVDLPVVYSSHFWLARVISESLWAAVKAVPNGGTLDIELRQMGPRMLIVFKNSGMWPARAEDATLLANPNAQPAVDGKTESTKAPPPPNAKDLIGFHLCQRILSLHGGQLHEDEEDGLRNFVIDLPTGAPYHAEDAALDAAQAQRYAADLSLLMARRRQKTG